MSLEVMWKQVEARGCVLLGEKRSCCGGQADLRMFVTVWGNCSAFCLACDFSHKWSV